MYYDVPKTICDIKYFLKRSDFMTFILNIVSAFHGKKKPYLMGAVESLHGRAFTVKWRDLAPDMRREWWW